MKIAMVFPVFDKAGGIGRALVELSVQLAGDGHEVHVVANSWDRSYADRGLIFHRVPMVKPNNPLQMSSFALASTAALRGKLARERFDVVHSHGLAALEADVVTAQSCHRAWVELSNPTLKPFSAAWLRRRLNPKHPTMMAIERHLYGERHCRKIVSVSHGVKQEIMRLYDVPDEAVAVIPNGVNPDEFAAERLDSQREATRASLGLAPHDRALLFVANEFPRKGLDALLDGLALLPPSVHLLCVGKGNPQPYLPAVARHGLGPRVHFIAHTPHVRAYYAAADLFVFPTQYEAFSLATLEAAAAGLPLLCTRVNGTDELIADGINGLFIARDGRDIAAKVQWVLDGPDRVAALGRAARESAKNYQWDRIKDRHVTVYEEVADAKRGVPRRSSAMDARRTAGGASTI